MQIKHKNQSKGERYIYVGIFSVEIKKKHGTCLSIGSWPATERKAWRDPFKNGKGVSYSITFTKDVRGIICKRMHAFLSWAEDNYSILHEAPKSRGHLFITGSVHAVSIETTSSILMTMINYSHKSTIKIYMNATSRLELELSPGIQEVASR